MTDIVERLDSWIDNSPVPEMGLNPVLLDAKAEIEKLRAENARLKAENDLWVPKLSAKETGVLCVRAALSSQKEPANG